MFYLRDVLLHSSDVNVARTGAGEGETRRGGISSGPPPTRRWVRFDRAYCRFRCASFSPFLIRPFTRVRYRVERTLRLGRSGLTRLEKCLSVAKIKKKSYIFKGILSFVNVRYQRPLNYNIEMNDRLARKLAMLK